MKSDLIKSLEKIFPGRKIVLWEKKITNINVGLIDAFEKNFKEELEDLTNKGNCYLQANNRKICGLI